MKLAPFALDPDQSRGRLYDELRADFRSPYQRDRDRIIHSTAFRRLSHKTQVFVAHEGDLFRSRLTHSLEVAQVARTLARRLALNEDAAETIALSHDLGHPPFGHTGEEVLAEKMRGYGGFDHNAQAIRIVTRLEERYPAFHGLNLTWESLEGIAKHNGPVQAPVPWALDDFNQEWNLELSSFASLEAQVAAIADDIAYNHHDIQDGIRAGLISDDDVCSVPLIHRLYEEAKQEWPDAAIKYQRNEALSRFFAAMINNVTQETVANLAFSPQSAQDIRAHESQIVRFSDDYFLELKELRQFLFDRLYRHPNVMDMRERAGEIISRAFDYAMNAPEILPQDWSEAVDLNNETERARMVCDYISGMTDNYISVDWHFAHGIDWPNRAK